MSKIIGVTFADQFGVDEKWLQNKGVFNPTLDVDSPLFIDPFLLAHSKQKEFSDCGFTAYEEHFATIHRLLLGSEAIGDKAWAAALAKFKFSEAKGMGGTCLGYSANSTNGRAFGQVLSKRALTWAMGVIHLGVKDPELFSSMSLFEKGIGPDLISDMTTSICLPCILEFNSRVLAQLEAELGVKVPVEHFRLRGIDTALPRNPFSNHPTPIILLADDVLKHLPLMNDPMGLAGIAEHNNELRDRVNSHIGEIFKIRTKREKEIITERAMADAAAFQTFLDLMKILENKPYNIYQDKEGLLAWSTAASDFTAAHALKIKDDKGLSRIDRIEAVCKAIIDQFTELVEHNRLWRLFYVDQEPRPERFAQLLFYAIAKIYCAANDLDISPEADGGAGPVDFKFSDGADKVVVEMKLSTNQNVVKGYQKQLTAYMEAENTPRGHYVVIDVGKMGNKWKELQAVAAKDKDFAKLKRIHLVDGSYRDSASKLR